MINRKELLYFVVLVLVLDTSDIYIIRCPECIVFETVHKHFKQLSVLFYNRTISITNYANTSYKFIALIINVHLKELKYGKKDPILKSTF